MLAYSPCDGRDAGELRVGDRDRHRDGGDRHTGNDVRGQPSAVVVPQHLETRHESPQPGAA